MVHASHVNILEGNIFGCNHDLPSGDPNKNDYVCGSQDLNQVAEEWLALFGLLVIPFLCLILFMKIWNPNDQILPISENEISVYSATSRSISRNRLIVEEKVSQVHEWYY